jgi:hypothetical protein
LSTLFAQDPAGKNGPLLIYYNGDGNPIAINFRWIARCGKRCSASKDRQLDQTKKTKTAAVIGHRLDGRLASTGRPLIMGTQ